VVADALDSGAKGANHLKGNFVDLEAIHGTSLVAAASRPSCLSSGMNLLPPQIPSILDLRQGPISERATAR
jgi:hypothetical protein